MPDPFGYLPDVTEVRDDWAERQTNDGQPVDRHHPERLGRARRPSDAGAARGGNAPALGLGSGGRTAS
jgi:hypothetical protein